MKIRIYNNNNALTQLKEEWHTLYTQTSSASIFLTWEWMYTWWQNYRPKLNTPRLHLVAFYDNEDTLKALIPLFTYKQGRLSVCAFLGTLYESSDYLDILVHPDISDASLLKAMQSIPVDKLMAHSDIWLISNAFKDARLTQLARSLFPAALYEQRRTSVCPYLPLPENEEALFKQLSKNMKSTLRRTRNKINKDPQFSIDLIDKTELIDEAVTELFRLHNLRFTDKKQATKFNYQQRGTFHKKIARLWLTHDRLRFYRIRYANEAIGFLYCYYHNNTILYMQAGFHPDYGKYGLGNQLMLRAMNDGMAAGAVEFDFMRGNESYKYKWTSRFRELYTTRIALTSRGTRLLKRDALLDGIKQFIRSHILKP